MILEKIASAINYKGGKIFILIRTNCENDHFFQSQDCKIMIPKFSGTNFLDMIEEIRLTTRLS